MELTIPLFQVKSSNCEPLSGDGRKEQISFDENKCFFVILSFSDFLFREIVDFQLLSCFIILKK